MSIFYILGLKNYKLAKLRKNRKFKHFHLRTSLQTKYKEWYNSKELARPFNHIKIVFIFCNDYDFFLFVST